MSKERELLAYCEAEAEALIRAHVGVVQALIDALVDRGTLTSDEIDLIIAGAVAGERLSAALSRRANWRKRELSAKCFAAEYGHAGDASVPHGAHDVHEPQASPGQGERPA
jgi:hypothetical protein